MFCQNKTETQSHKQNGHSVAAEPRFLCDFVSLYYKSVTSCSLAQISANRCERPPRSLRSRLPLTRGRLTPLSTRASLPLVRGRRRRTAAARGSLTEFGCGFAALRLLLDREPESIKCAVVSTDIHLTQTAREAATVHERGNRRAAVPQFLACRRVKRVQDRGLRPLCTLCRGHLR